RWRLPTKAQSVMREEILLPGARGRVPRDRARRQDRVGRRSLRRWPPQDDVACRCGSRLALTRDDDASHVDAIASGQDDAPVALVVQGEWSDRLPGARGKLEP